MNKKIKKLIEKYNQPENILVVSSYPERGVKYSGKVCAVGGFAKNTLKSLKKEYQDRGEKRNFVVLTVTTNGREEVYEDNGVLVIRCLKRDKLLSYLSLLNYIFKFSRVADVMVEFEFASFGRTLMTGSFPLVLALMRILGKRTVLVLHQVVFDLNQLTGHVGFKKGSLKLLFFQSTLRIFYWLLSLPARKIVVLEKEFKDKLSKLVNPAKITIIPHGVDTDLKLISKTAARKKLGIKKSEKILLYFGYLTWYKGIDWLLDKVKNYRLIVAGGVSFTQKDKPHYKQFIKRVYQLAEKKNIEITGFLPEKKIALYFAAADLVVLPYRTFMSSSGPLSLAISSGKPFIISKPMSKILQTSDFKETLKELGLKKRDLVFELTEQSLGEKLQGLEKLRKLERLSLLMREKRSFDNLSAKYTQVLKEKELSIKERFLPAFRFLKAN